MLRANGFFAKVHRFNKSCSNPTGNGILHQFQAISYQGQQLIADSATGLTWQQSGSAKYMKFVEVAQYIQDLNIQNYGGHNDWRLPTLEEAMSLVEPTVKNGDLYINSVFDSAQRYIWTMDISSVGTAWYVFFSYGNCYFSATDSNAYVRAVRSGQ